MDDFTTLNTVLHEAHSKHHYITDKEQYGKNDYWTIGLIGDCEDFALWIRSELKKRNIDSNLVYCLTEKNNGHLVVHSQGWILDNRHKTLKSFSALPYTWISANDKNNNWYKLK